MKIFKCWDADLDKSLSIDILANGSGYAAINYIRHNWDSKYRSYYEDHFEVNVEDEDNNIVMVVVFVELTPQFKYSIYE